MKLTKVELHGERAEDKKAFTRFDTMKENLRKGVLVASLIVASSFGINCGGDPRTPVDSGDPVVDGGHDAGSGGGDAGGPDLCSTYPNGSVNRVTFPPGAIGRPANNPDGWLMFFSSIVVESDGTFATFGIYPSTFSTPPVYYGFSNGQTKALPIPNTGNVSFQVCNMTAMPCSVGAPLGAVTGDPNCLVTVASDRPIGPAH